MSRTYLRAVTGSNFEGGLRGPRLSRLALLFILALAVTGCGIGSGEEEEGSVRAGRLDGSGKIILLPGEQEALGLETAAAVQGVLTTSALRFGKVSARPQEDALVAAPVTGRLLAQALAIGARVSPGDLLLTLEPLVDTASGVALEAQRRELQGQIEGAVARVEARKAELKRVSTLLSSGLATDAETAQARAELTAEEARVESLRRAGKELARATGGRLELRAPVAGVVAALITDSGSQIEQGTALARIIQAGPRWIDLAVPPGDPVGNEYRVQGFLETVPAELLNRGAVIQADGTRRDRLEAAPGASAGLPPGATVPVQVLHETRGILVPATAVVRNGRETIVFVTAGEGRFEPRWVRVSTRDETGAIIDEGVSAGELVVTRGAAALLGELGAAGQAQGGGESE